MPDYDILKGALEDLGVKDEVLKEEDEEEVLDGTEDELDDEEDEVEEEEVNQEEVVDDVVIEPVVEQPKPQKPTKEEKERFAFEELRRKAKASEEATRQLDEIAHAYGFASNVEMIAKLQQDASAKKAKEMGVDPKFYEDLQNTKKELEAIKRAREEEVTRNKVNTFISRIDEFAKENSLTETEKSELINTLDEDGFTIDTLSNIKNYKNLFSGYIKDKLLAKEQQKLFEKDEKRKRLHEDKLTDTGYVKEKFNLDTAVEALIKSNRAKY